MKQNNYFLKRWYLLLIILFNASIGMAEDLLIGEKTTIHDYPTNPSQCTLIMWESSDENCIRIVRYTDSTCDIEALNPTNGRTVTITHSWYYLGYQHKMHFYFTVSSDKPEYLKLSVKNLEIDEGVERTITASPDHSRATNYTLTWSAVSYGGAQSDVVKIINQSKESCTFKAVKAGVAYVKATTNNGVSASCHVSVTGIHPETMYVEGYVDGESTMYLGNNGILKTSFSPSNHHSSVTWKSDNPSIVSVSSNDKYSAKVNALAVGKAKITATSANGLVATHTITVKDQPISLVSTVPDHNEATNVPLDIIPTLTFSPDDIYINSSYPGFNEDNFCCLKASNGTIVARELIKTGSTFQLVPNRTLKPGTRYTITVPAGYLKSASKGEVNQKDYTLSFTTTKEGEGGLTATMEIQGLIGNKTTAYAPAVVTVRNNSNTECTGYAQAKFYNGGRLMYTRTSNKATIPAGQQITAYFMPDMISGDALVDIVATFVSDDGETVPAGKASVFFKPYNTSYETIPIESTDYYDETTNCYYTPLDNKTCYVKKYRSKSCSGNLVIPEEVNGRKVIGIGYQCFQSVQSGLYESLTIELPSTIEWIAAHAFSYCWAQKVTLNKGLKFIGQEAFYYSDIAEIELPDGIEMVASEAFRECDELKTLTLPHNSFDVGSYLWFNCTALESVYTYNTEPPLFAIQNFYKGSSTSSSSNTLNSKITLYVPQGTKQMYAAKAGWSRFGDIDKIVEFDAGVTPSLSMTSVSPKDGATSISVNIVPLVRFSSDVALATTEPGYDNEYITLTDEDGNVVMTKSAVQVYDNIVKLTPALSLQKNMRYTFTIGAGQIKRKGTDIVNTEDITFSFTTMEGERTKPLELVSTNPVDGATDVGLDVQPLMKFSPYASTHRNTPYEKIVLKKADGTEVPRVFCTGGDYIWVVPENPLEPNTTYTFTIGPGVFLDPATISPCMQEFSFSFTTGDPTGIRDLNTDKQLLDIYNLQGHKIRSKVSTTEGLPKGVYIINGKKIII